MLVRSRRRRGLDDEFDPWIIPNLKPAFFTDSAKLYAIAKEHGAEHLAKGYSVQVALHGARAVVLNGSGVSTIVVPPQPDAAPVIS